MDTEVVTLLNLFLNAAMVVLLAMIFSNMKDTAGTGNKAAKPKKK